jgi:uncharacterized protein (TIGR03089 family)
MPVTTFSDVLRRVVSAEPGRPLVTFYDEATGERVELSTTTYANWVAKVAGLLQDELGLERGMTLRLDLPAHWLGPVFLGAAWSVGLVVADEQSEREPDVVVCGPDGLDAWAPRAGELPVLACALLPLGVRFREPLPPGVVDVGVEVWGQPDAFGADDPPAGDDPAVDLGGSVVTHDELWSPAAAGSVLTDGGRLVTAANPASPPGLAAWTEPLLRGGSLVVVVHAGPERLDEIADAERATARYPARS